MLTPGSAQLNQSGSSLSKNVSPTSLTALIDEDLLGSASFLFENSFDENKNYYQSPTLLLIANKMEEELVEANETILVEPQVHPNPPIILQSIPDEDEFFDDHMICDPRLSRPPSLALPLVAAPPTVSSSPPAPGFAPPLAPFNFTAQPPAAAELMNLCLQLPAQQQLQQMQLQLQIQHIQQLQQLQQAQQPPAPMMTVTAPTSTGETTLTASGKLLLSDLASGTNVEEALIRACLFLAREQKKTASHPFSLPKPKKKKRYCSQCNTTNTPQWRRTLGPDGLDLCNACGLHQAKRQKLMDTYCSNADTDHNDMHESA